VKTLPIKLVHDAERYPYQFRLLTGLSYDDVMLIPQKGVLVSRKDADISAKLYNGGWRISNPVIAAPMSSVVNAAVAEQMYLNGGFSFLPRNKISIADQVQMFTDATIHNLNKRSEVCGAALGLNDEERLEKLYVAGCRVFILDVAHAHTIPVMNYLENLYLPEDLKLIIGSIATGEAARDFLDLGAVVGFRVGIGGGAACSTRSVTGFGVSQLSAIMEIHETIMQIDSNRRPTIIADGAIKNSGDIVKALAAGADTVMVGRLLAGASESPFPGEYFGEASGRVNGHRAPEGVAGSIPIEGTIEDLVKNLTWGIRSGLSYGGANNIDELREKAEFAIISHGVTVESSTRI
jgi:IMP dehydrogenase/GMP reductase